MENTRPDGDTVVGSGSVNAALAQLIERRADWEPLVRFDAVDRTRVRMAIGEFEAWVLTWLPQQATSWHVHRRAGCFAVVLGELTEQVGSYPSAVDLDCPGSTPARVISVPTPHQVAFNSHHLHRLVNLSLEPAVSLHVMEPTLSPRSAPRPGERDDFSDSEELLSPGEVAAYFRVHPKTITRWAESGRLSSVRTLGNHRRFLASEVRALRRDQHE